MSAIKQEILAYLAKRGYKPNTSMESYITKWNGWYQAKNDWYETNKKDSNTNITYKVRRISIKPARMVCQEWASLLFNDKLTISCESSEQANAWLEMFSAASSFISKAQGATERGFALGTAAIAARVVGAPLDGSPSDSARIALSKYDARYIVPLSYDDDSISECAFVSSITIRGQKLTQLQMHIFSAESDTYVLKAVFFNDKGKIVEPEGFIGEYDTGSKSPLFFIIKPGLENSIVDYSPFGVSVFDDALGAVRLVDEYVDNMHRDVHVGQTMVFLSDSLIRRDDRGNAIVPRADDQQMFVGLEDGVERDLIKEYSPNLRVDQGRSGISTALQLLGMRTGFGEKYWSFENKAGLKTATEVSSDNSSLMRSIKKHENSIEPPLKAFVYGLLSLQERISGTSFGTIGDVLVNWDDSIISDSATQRNQDMTDVLNGVMQPWEYRVNWYGESEEEARKATTTSSASATPLSIGEEA